MMTPRRLIASLALILSGCAGAPHTYPSLAKRAIESAPMQEAPAPPIPQAADAALMAQIKGFTDQAAKGASAFDAAFAKAEKAASAAKGAAVSSDAWVAAQVAISALEAARNDSVSALASLDSLYVQRTNDVADGKASGGLDEIDAARKATLKLVDDQNDRIDAMKARLPQA